METQSLQKKFITTGLGVPATLSPISQAVVVGDLCFVSGQLPVDQAGSLVPGPITTQASLALDNLVAVLRAAGFDINDIVYIDVALLNIADMFAINALFAESFPSNQRPARTVYQAAGLPLNSLVKFQAVALRTP